MANVDIDRIVDVFENNQDITGRFKGSGPVTVIFEQNPQMRRVQETVEEGDGDENE